MPKRAWVFRVLGGFTVWNSIEEAMQDPLASLFIANGEFMTVWAVADASVGIGAPMGGSEDSARPVINIVAAKVKTIMEKGGPENLAESDLEKFNFLMIDPDDLAKVVFSGISMLTCRHVMNGFGEVMQKLQEEGHTCSHFPEGVPPLHETVEKLNDPGEEE